MTRAPVVVFPSSAESPLHHSLSVPIMGPEGEGVRGGDWRRAKERRGGEDPQHAIPTLATPWRLQSWPRFSSAALREVAALTLGAHFTKVPPGTKNASFGNGRHHPPWEPMSVQFGWRRKMPSVRAQEKTKKHKEHDKEINKERSHPHCISIADKTPKKEVIAMFRRRPPTRRTSRTQAREGA